MTDAEIAAQLATLNAEKDRRARAVRLQEAQRMKMLLVSLTDGDGGQESPLDLLCPDHSPPRYGGITCDDTNHMGYYRVLDDDKENRCVRCKVLYAASLSALDLVDVGVSVTLEAEVIT